MLKGLTTLSINLDQVIRMVGESGDAVSASVGGGSSTNKMPTLEEYGTNLTKLAEEVVCSTVLFLNVDFTSYWILVIKRIFHCRVSWILLLEGSHKLNESPRSWDVEPRIIRVLLENLVLERRPLQKALPKELQVVMSLKQLRGRR